MSEKDRLKKIRYVFELFGFHSWALSTRSIFRFLQNGPKPTRILFQSNPFLAVPSITWPFVLVDFCDHERSTASCISQPLTVGETSPIAFIQPTLCYFVHFWGEFKVNRWKKTKNSIFFSRKIFLYEDLSAFATVFFF